MSWKYVVLLAAASVALLFVLVKGFGRDPHAVPFLLEGKPAPTFNIKDLSTGERVTMDRFKGRPMVINFWASWCGPCAEEAPVLDWGARNFGRDVAFLGVVFEDTEEAAKEAITAQHLNFFPQYMDPLSKMAVDYGASGVPETYFVDASGIIRNKFVGPIDPDTLRQRIHDLGTPAGAQAEARP